MPTLSQQEPPSSPPSGRLPRPRFSLLSLMLVSGVVSVAASGGYYLMRSLQQGASSSRAVFVIFILAAPVLCTVIVGISYHLLAWTQKKR